MQECCYITGHRPNKLKNKKKKNIYMLLVRQEPNNLYTHDNIYYNLQ